MAAGADLGCTIRAVQELSMAGLELSRHSPETSAQLCKEAAATSESKWEVEICLSTPYKRRARERTKDPKKDPESGPGSGDLS